jgi:F-type H+-transporting ATPase subunit b
MEETINALGRLLLQALPTFFLVVFLHFYLKAVFFKPLERTLAARQEATEGARKAAEESLRRAAEKTAHYEESIRAARNEIYKEQEQVRNQWRDDQSAQVSAARSRANALVADAKAQLEREAEQAKTALAGDSRMLADRVTETILKRRVA